MALLKGDYDVLYILFNAHQRACFQIFVSAVLHEVAGYTACLREQLHFIENKQRLILMEFGVVIAGKVQGKGVKVLSIAQKNLFKIIADSVSQLEYRTYTPPLPTPR